MISNRFWACSLVQLLCPSMLLDARKVDREASLETFKPLASGLLPVLVPILDDVPVHVGC